MKTYLAALAMFFIFNPYSVQAQLSIGAGIGYGTEVEEVGIRLNAMYRIIDKVRASADFLYYLDGIEDVYLFETNINGHYILVDKDKFLAYGLAGLNIYTAGVSFDGENYSDSEVGLNLGAGGQYKFSPKISGLAEVKYAISNIDQLVIGIGVLVNLGQ